MASIRELYIQLGYQPSNDRKDVPHPTTGDTHQFFIPESGEMLRELRPHAELRKLLFDLKTFVEEVVEASSSSHVGTMTEAFLDTAGNGKLYWSNGNGIYQAPQWPRDKGLQVILVSEHLQALANYA